MLTDELWFMIRVDLIACNRIIVIVTDSSMIQDIPKMASTTRVKIGDEVCITLSVRELREAQQNFGGYQDEMESVCTFQQFRRVHVVHKMLKMIKSKLFVQSCPSQEILNQCFVKEYNILTTLRCCCLFFFRLLVNEGWSTDSLIAAGSLLNTKKTDGSLTQELSAKYVTTRTNRKIT